MKSRHIDVRRVADGVEVVADDYELFDYLEDVFTDGGLVSDYSREEERNGARFYVLHFGKGVTYDEVAATMDGLSEEEIERIYKVNN